MDYSLKLSVLVASIVLTGLSSGLCFTWSNAVTPGIGELNNFGYLSAFQQMNRSILNPAFMIVFFSPILLDLVAVYLYKGSSTQLLWSLILASSCYFFGVVMVTIFGNVPLNELLDKTDLSLTDNEGLQELRNQFEAKWNRLHLIRTISSFISFLLILLALLIKK
ncbi:MAG: hypothetical protein COA50_10360 [Flavobacteriaceae bacterium]|nr:MAG: hypothetical protein COA50_10360 [Flavobacteriaceae bacterium]